MSVARRMRAELFPLFWLVYLLLPLLALLGAPRPVPVYVGFVAGVAVFLWLYVRAFSMFRPCAVASSRWSYLGWAWCLLLYAVLFPVLGAMSSTFLIYGASFIGFQARSAHAFWLTFLNVSVMLAPVALGLYELRDLVWLAPNSLIAVSAAFANQASFRRMLADRRLAQAQAEKEKLAQTAERERIARDLHDLLGHTLSVIVLKSELAAKLAERDPERAAREIREVERISRDALGEVRAAVRGYRGSGFTAELARSKVALDVAGIALEYDGQPLELPGRVEAAMEMVLREAITNVVRHSRARNVRVRVVQTRGHYELEVHDDGTGGDATEGSGLAGMRERVRAFGGVLTRDRRSGTRLLVRLPCPDGSAEAPVHAYREAGV